MINDARFTGSFYGRVGEVTVFQVCALLMVLLRRWCIMSRSIFSMSFSRSASSLAYCAVLRRSYHIQIQTMAAVMGMVRTKNTHSLSEMTGSASIFHAQSVRMGEACVVSGKAKHVLD